MYITTWITKHKKLTKLFVVLFAVALAFIILSQILSQFVSVSFPSSEAYTTFSIVFDVNNIKSVNKMTIETPTGITTITDQSIIEKVIKETTISNSTGVGCFSWGSNVNANKTRVGNEICLYENDKLIRRMPQSWQVDGCWGNSKFANFIAVKIFKKDTLHYIAGSNEIWAYLPIDLIEQLEDELLKNGNSYFTD